MAGIGVNSKSNIKDQPPASASASRGFDSLYASLFGSGERRNYSSNPASPPSANESLYPSSPYHHQHHQQHHQMPTSSQMHSSGLGQTQNGLPFQSQSSDKWHPSRSSPGSPQHQEEPYSIGPFDSIWSMRSSEMTDPSAGVQRQQKARNWSSDSPGTAEYRSPQSHMSASNGLPFGGYNQQPYSHNDVGFHGDGRGMPGSTWSTNDGVSDANVPGIGDWQWNQGDYSTMPSGNWHSNGFGMENHEMNDWEVYENEQERRNRGAEMAGMQERREWKRKGFLREYVPGGSVYKQKPASSVHAKPSVNDKVVASFLEKYIDKDHSPFTLKTTKDSKEKIPSSTGDDEGISQIPSAVIEELGPVCQENRNSQHIGQPTVNNLDALVSETAAGDHIRGKSYSPEPAKTELTKEHQETTSNVDSSDLADRLVGREARSLSDPVTVQEVQQNSNSKNGTSSRRCLNNGKIRPGKRKPKLPRDKRRSLSQAEKSDAKSCEKQTCESDTKEQKKDPPELNVQSSKPTIPPQSKSDKKGNSLPDSNDFRDKEYVSDIGCFESSICDDCTYAQTSDPRANCPSPKISPSSLNEENIGEQKPEILLGVSNKRSSEIRRDASSSKETVTSGKNGTSNPSVDKSVSAGKVVSNGHKSKGKKCANTSKVLQQKKKVHPVGNPAMPIIDNSDTSSRVKLTRNAKSQNMQEKDTFEFVKQITEPNEMPHCKSNDNIFHKNTKYIDEIESNEGSKRPVTTGNLNKNSTDPDSLLIQDQEKKAGKDKDLFFDPKRIFGGSKTAKSPGKKDTEKSPNSSAGNTVPRSSQSTDAMNHQAKDTAQGYEVEHQKESVLTDPPVVQHQKSPKQSPDSSAVEERMTNPTIRTTDLPPKAAQTVPTTSAKDALASKVPIMKAEPEPSRHQSGSTYQSASPTEPRASRLYSYKMDSKTGILRRSSDPKVEEVSRQSQRRDSSGTLSSSDEGKGERRCSGDSHMDGFHHPFGCSAECYKRSSSPSTSRSSSSSGQASSPADKGASSSTSSAKKDPTQRSQEKAPHIFPHPEEGSADRDFEASAFAELREGLKDSWLSKEKRKEDQRQEQERIQREHLRKVQQQEKLEQKRQQEQRDQQRREKEDQRRHHEKQEQRKQQEREEKRQQQEKRHASASNTKRPTRATYSSPRSAEQETKDMRSGASRDRPGSGTNTQQSRRPWPSEDRTRAAAEDESTEDSDTEENLTGGITDEWWFHFGKKLCNGVIWFFLFSVLLCLVLLSFVLAL